MNKLQEEIANSIKKGITPFGDDYIIHGAIDKLYSLIEGVAVKYALWRDTECVESIKNDFEYFVKHIYNEK